MRERRERVREREMREREKSESGLIHTLDSLHCSAHPLSQKKNSQPSTAGALCSVFGVECSVFGARCSMFGARCSAFYVRCSVHGASCSVLVQETKAVCQSDVTKQPAR